MSLKSPARKIVVWAAAAFLMACSATDEGPTGPQFDPAFAVGDLVNDLFGYVPGVAYVCAFYPDGIADPGPSTFEATATGGDILDGSFELNGFAPPHCMEVWNDTDASLVDVTGTLLAAADGLVLERIVTLESVGGAEPTSETTTDSNSATVTVSDQIHGSIWFKFAPDDTPPGGGEGCTPGYWRQEHHYDSWPAPYSPDDLFSTYFDDYFPGMTLGEVVMLKGGHLNALGRHAVAALLNAASGGVDYDLAVADVIAAFNAAAAAGGRSIEEQKNVFDFLNNQGCGLS